MENSTRAIMVITFAYKFNTQSVSTIMGKIEYSGFLLLSLFQNS